MVNVTYSLKHFELSVILEKLYINASILYGYTNLFILYLKGAL